MGPNAESSLTTNSHKIMYSDPATASKPQNALPKHQKKSVSWAEPSSTQEYCALRTTDSSSWYQWYDIMVFKSENRSICRLAIDQEQGGNNVHSSSQQLEQCCTRGLEIMMNGEDRVVRKQRAATVVLQEQQDQRDQKTYSPHFIAELYNEISSLAQNDAHILGLQDQQEAASIHSDEEKKTKAATTKTKKAARSSGGTLFHRISHARIFRTGRTTFAPACA